MIYAQFESPVEGLLFALLSSHDCQKHDAIRSAFGDKKLSLLSCQPIYEVIIIGTATWAKPDDAFHSVLSFHCSISVRMKSSFLIRPTTLSFSLCPLRRSVKLFPIPG